MEILVFKDNQIYRIDGIDPEFGCVSLVEVQAFYDQENLCVQELNELSNIETVPSGEFLSALGAALSQNAPKLADHRNFWNSPLRLSENRRQNFLPGAD